MTGAPAFWLRPRSLEAWLLAPLGTAYGLVAQRRMRPRRTPPLPALYVGNFVVGGAGKTPAAAHLCDVARSFGFKPAVLSRGYGGALSGRKPVIVDTRAHLASQVGDEPFLLARSEMVVVGSDREASARLAAQAGATFLILDDGFQSAPFKAPALVVADGATGVGNGKVLPAGPLRVPLAHQWRFVTALLVLGAGEAGTALAREAEARGLPSFLGRLTAHPDAAARLRGRKVYAFAGVARPDKFFATLEEVGATIVGRRSFRDHHCYSVRDARNLAAARRAAQAELLATTEKDLARLPPGSPQFQILENVFALPVRVEIDRTEAFASWFSAIYRPSL